MHSSDCTTVCDVRMHPLLKSGENTVAQTLSGSLVYFSTLKYYSLFQKDLQSGLGLKKYEGKGNLDNKVHRMAC